MAMHPNARVLLTWHANGDETTRVRRHMPSGVELVAVPARPYLGRYDADPADLAELARDADVLIGWAEIPRAAIEGAERLRFIGWLHAGCDQLDFPLLRARGIQVSNVTGANAVPVAEQAFMFVLALAKRLLDNHRAVVETRAHSWWEPDGASEELAGRTMAIVGLGRIGEEVALRAKAFGMTVLGVKRDPSRHRGVADRVYGPDDLREVLYQADFIVLAAPLTPETRHLIGEEELRAMRRHAYLVNVARGELVHEGPLARALQEGWIAGFASDVWWDYAAAMPPSYHFAMPSRLGVHRLPNVLASGDAAANVLAVRDRMIELGAESVGAYLRGETPPRLVDPARGY
jgi:phosphoglycerate dehydrogenase-like enzyme